jgi:hypothetical protein
MLGSMAPAPAPDPIRRRVRELHRTVGERHTLARLGISRPTLYRLLASLPITAGSMALVRQRLDALDAEERRRREQGAA